MAIERKPANVTRKSILSAMAEHDGIGRDAFLYKYGFRRATLHLVLHDGRSYDSKAIVGAAFGYLPGNPAPLRSNEFYGGQPSIRPLLREGFSFDLPHIEPKKAKNPLWTREQVILVLDLYTRHKGRDPGVNHPEVIEMSALLGQMATEAGLSTYRNPSGVIMKMMNFRSLDPAFTIHGGRGLKGASRLDKTIWSEFADRPQQLAVAAEAIREGALASMDETTLDDLQGYKANEGKVSYRLHRTLERDQKIVTLRKSSALRTHGKLECEACGFDFVATYGERGLGFIEAHHTNPVHAMLEGDETVLEDLALVCSNCHRIIHKAKPWLTISEVKALLVSGK